MGGFLTVGHPAAVAAVHAMLASHVPHAVLFLGPTSVGKRSLALDLAAGLLCSGATGGERPCRACRSCRMVAHGNHPDIHVLEPEGPGGQIRIGGPDMKPPGRGVRDLVMDLALLPAEGVARVAIIGDAQRMNDEAQSALLKTLEEPPSRTTLILCTDDEERMLPTVRSRCAKVRLGTVSARDIETLLGARDLADAPTAGRLARLVGGRPGLAVAYARAPEAEAIRSELSRTLIDLLDAGHATRLQAAKGLQSQSLALVRLLRPSAAPATPQPQPRGRGPARAKVAPVVPEPDEAGDPDAPVGEGSTRKVPAAERRRALALLLDAWHEVARDLALAQAGAPKTVRDVALMEELDAAARDLEPGAAAGALARLVRASELLDSNVSPELVLDVLLIRWPRRRRAA